MSRGKTTVPNELAAGLNYFTPRVAARVAAIWTTYGSLIAAYCQQIPPRLVAARIQVESGGNPDTVATAQQWETVYGAEMGLLQLSPDTRAKYNITVAQAKDPATNLRVACDLWNSWADTIFKEQAGAVGLEVPVWTWLVTAIGPGATRRLRTLAKGYNLSALQQVAGDTATMQANASYWRSQSPALVAWRVGVAIAAAKHAVGGAGGLLAGVVIGVVGYFLAKRFL